MGRIVLLFLFLIQSFIGLNAQVQYDECRFAFSIDNPANYCSDAQEFTTVGATESTRMAPDCWGDVSNDIWFTFVAVATDISIIVEGQTGANGGGTLRNPQAALIFGDCNAASTSILECASDNDGQNIIELNQGALIPGVRYYIRVDGVDVETGTFRICTNNFTPPAEPGQDCATASVLCDTVPFVINVLQGSGQNPNEAVGTCLDVIAGMNSEDQSTWFKWEAANDGFIEFVLTPLKSDDDLDFVVYELTNGIGDCSAKTPLRCVATSCQGPTGLRRSSEDLMEDFDCEPNEDGFAAAIQQEPGKAYALIINNFTTSGIGFSFEFTGTAVISGPVPDFEVVPEQDINCEELLTIQDQSTFSTGEIVGWSWSFGEEAEPGFMGGPGPHEISYASFGAKFILLTVESDEGCVKSVLKRFDVDTCCQRTDEISLIVDEVNDLACFDIPEGSILVSGQSNYETSFEFDINNQNDFRSINLFENLDVGTYFVKVRDRRGCVDSTMITLSEPDELIVDAGEDVAADLGARVNFEATYTPPSSMVNTMWLSSNGDTIICLDIPDCLEIEVLPPGPTDYVVTVVDEMGCIAMDTVRAEVEVNRNVYFPNTFSPNMDGQNDYFNLFGNPGAIVIEELSIFDRWGSLLSYQRGVPLNDESRGWDGTAGDKPLDPGVFTFVAKVLFVDQQIITYSGPITLIR